MPGKPESVVFWGVPGSATQTLTQVLEKTISASQAKVANTITKKVTGGMQRTGAKILAQFSKRT